MNKRLIKALVDVANYPNAHRGFYTYKQKSMKELEVMGLVKKVDASPELSMGSVAHAITPDGKEFLAALKKR